MAKGWGWIVSPHCEEFCCGVGGGGGVVRHCEKFCGIWGGGVGPHHL